ncbi:MAG TPA: organomercurial lyase [Thermoanaerobaculia bacterium]|nr:organomercurial lyase [Thermoanaerobaculia bacterium]
MDEDVRRVTYELTMREGTPPLAERVAEELGVDVDRVRESFRRLADARMLVLRPRTGEILMAGPFSAVETPFRVRVGAMSCFANCVWDAFGIPAMLKQDAVIETSCAASMTTAELRVRNGEVSGSGFMHFVVPARLWWTHIVYT